MAPKGSIFFSIGETLGALVVDSSGLVARVDVYSYVPALLESLNKRGLALGAISKAPPYQALIADNVLERSGISQYFSRELLIHDSGLALRKEEPVETFEQAKAQAQHLGAEDCVFVGESRGERTLARLAGMKAAPHPLLAEAVLAGETPVYVELRTSARRERAVWAALEKAPVVPLYRTISDEAAQIIALTTDGTVPRLQAAGFNVVLLSHKADAVHHDLYLLQDAAGLDQDPAFVSELTARDFTPVLSLTGGLIIALPPQQNIDAFHFGKSHGHNLKLLPDPTLLGPRIEVVAPESLAELSAHEMQSIASVITEARMEEMLRFVSGMDARSEGVGSNRHVLNPQMRAVTDGLMVEFERIGGGSFQVTGHRFEISGREVKDARGVPVAERLEMHNVIAELPGESDELVLVTAHLDSTAARTYGRDNYDPTIHDAPGVDDDGSGVAAVLLIAEAMRTIFASHKPPRTIRFVLFNAEEQGFIGSGRYARCQAMTGAKVVGVFQLDMIGYNVLPPNSFETHAGTSDGTAEPNSDVEQRSVVLSNLVREMSELLGREGLSVLTPAQVYESPDDGARRSDHLSFHQRGYAACLTSEDFFPSPSDPSDPSEGNPHYHMATDQLVNVNLAFATSIARVVCAAALRVCAPIMARAYSANR